MKYEKTGEKVNKQTAKNAEAYSIKNVRTSTLLWAVVKRHKFGLVLFWAILMTSLYVLPSWPAEAISILGSL